MFRSDDASLRPAWGSWLVASVVMAIPLVWVGSHTLEEPLYVAGSPLVVRVASGADANHALRSDSAITHSPIQNRSRPLAMTPK